MAGREKPGFQFGKSDLERVGLFIEASYMNGKGYVQPTPAAPLDRLKGGTFHFMTPKWKTELQDCYFDQKFKRMFEKEPYYDEFKEHLKEQKESAKRNRTGRFITVAPAKLPSTPGDHFGTFSDKISAFSPLTKPKPKIQEPKPFVIKDAKKGGPGYADITFDKYPEHKDDPYDGPRKSFWKTYQENVAKSKGKFYSTCYPRDYFEPNPYKTDKIMSTYRKIYKDRPEGSQKEKFLIPGPAKELGGNKSGCFDKITYASEKYLTEHQVDKELSAKLLKYKSHDSGRFVPNIGIRSWRLKSTVNYNVNFKVNEKNWRTVQPITYPCQ